MRIQTNILLWGFFAFVVPLTTLALVATYYSQASYLKDVKQKIHQNLGFVSSQVENRLSSNRALALGLSQAFTIQSFLPTLANIDQQALTPKFKQQVEAVNQFFEGFQTIIPSSFIIRILDSQANTLIKVTHKQRSLPTYDSLLGVSYVEQELTELSFIQTLRALPKNDASSLVLPHNKAYTSPLSLLDNVVPLYYQNKWIGALSLTIIGEDIDKILKHTIRPFNGKILITEINPDSEDRNGLILFDDENNLHIRHQRSKPKYIQKTSYSGLLDILSEPDKYIFTSKKIQNSLYYIDITPYPNQFINWIIGFNIKNETINAPYTKIRITIWVVALATLLLGLILSQIGAQRVSKALSALVLNFKKYSQGDTQQVATTENCVNELKDLGNAFNSMTKTLNNAHQERDKAQNMMLQNNKLASIGLMAAGIGHEINNPLNNILSYAKLAIRNMELNIETIEPEIKNALLSDLKSIREETLRASEIVSGIMNFARQVPPHFTPFNITNWLDSSIALTQQAANKKKIHFNKIINIKENALINADHGQLQQVLVNLLLNAIQASYMESEISIYADIADNKLNISISDNGDGIAADALALIFDPFFTTKQQTQGTGLGLSISLGIIQAHHGLLDIQNKDNNHGVLAKITLPLNLDF